MNKPTTLEERRQTGTLADPGMTDRGIAARPGWSVHTIRKWRRRWQQVGGHDGAGNLFARCPLQGITVEALIGTMTQVINLPVFQLALPLSWADSRALRLIEH